MNKNLIEALKVVLADSYVLFLKTQNYHWNVVGHDFKSLHLMFEDQYNDLFKGIDLIAERIRALGDFAPGSFANYKKITNIVECDTQISSHQMVADLADDQEKIIKSLTKVLKEAQNSGDEVTLSMMADRIEIHQKNEWMLRSTLQPV